MWEAMVPDVGIALLAILMPLESAEEILACNRATVSIFFFPRWVPTV
jgi:hypothetical protein